MNFWHFTPISVIYFLALGISLMVALLSVRIKAVKGARLFTIMMLFVSCWILATILGLFNNNESWKILMLKFEYFGMAGAVYFWLIFIAFYTQIDSWLNKYIYIFLAVIPLVTLFHIMKAPEGTLIHNSFVFIEKKGLTILGKDYGFLFYVWAAYAYLMMTIGFVFIIVRILRTPKSNRKQLYYIVPIIFLIIIPNLFFISDNNPIEPYDPTPLALVIVGILFLITMYFHDFLSVVPIAQQLIFNNMKGGVIVMDNKEKIIDINKVCETIINKQKNEVIGKYLSDTLPELCGLYNSFSGNEDFKTEITLGIEKRVYELRITYLHDQKEHVRGYVMMFWDITEQKMALIELDAYARTVAHDLKNPLGHIMGCAQVLLEPGLSEEDQKEYLDGIISGSEKMANIIDGLLMMAKIRNQDVVEKTMLNMEEILDTVITRMNDMIIRYKATINLPNRWNHAKGNTLWIEEIWVNLISNAIKYGGNPPVIWLGSEEKNGKVRFWITDNGNGLSKEEQQLIFSEFTRIHPNKENIKGHGLGLSIVQRIVKKLGGEAGVKSEKGKGSTFHFILPSE